MSAFICETGSVILFQTLHIHRLGPVSCLLDLKTNRQIQSTLKRIWTLLTSVVQTSRLVRSSMCSMSRLHSACVKIFNVSNRTLSDLHVEFVSSKETLKVVFCWLLSKCDVIQVDLFTSTNSPDNSLGLFPSMPQSSWVTVRNMTHLILPERPSWTELFASCHHSVKIASVYSNRRLSKVRRRSLTSVNIGHVHP